MGYLKNSQCYLSGAIEACTEKENWRVAPIKVMTERFGINVFDPHADPKQGKGEALRKAKAEKNLETIHDITSGFVRKDLAMIDRSDFLIARFAYEETFYKEDIEFCLNHRFAPKAHLRQVPTTGTIHEVINADLYHKPTLLICELGAEYIPSWLIGFVPLRYLFGSWDALYTYLQEVDDGKHEDDKRWALVYDLI